MGRVKAEGITCVKPLKCDRFGKWEELKEVKCLDCHSWSILPPPIAFSTLAVIPVHSNCPFVQLFPPVSYLNAGTIILFYFWEILAYLGRCKQLSNRHFPEGGQLFHWQCPKRIQTRSLPPFGACQR